VAIVDGGVAARDGNATFATFKVNAVRTAISLARFVVRVIGPAVQDYFKQGCGSPSKWEGYRIEVCL
jgi:hypothetical protein